jgi:hypothetical protein
MRYNPDTEVFILFSTTFIQMLGEHLETCYVALLPDPSLMAVCFNHIIFDSHSAREMYCDIKSVYLLQLVEQCI